MQIGQHTFTLPEGFKIELVAGSPLVERPIVADIDDQGRLYVADSSGSNDNVQDQLKEKPHRIVRLEDTNGDGVYDESIVFADKLMFPEGVLWHQGAIYCGAPPEIWRFEDTNDDGVADKREVWFDAKTLTGCANDIHGPYMGKDGWIYWCKGAFAEQTHTLYDGRVIKDSAAHIFRCLPDGSEFDSVMSGGMDNPVEIAFDDSGDLFFTTTFYSHPRAGNRDALVHAIYGGVYPKDHGVLEGLTLTGEYLPAMTHLGPAAPSGLMRYESSRFGAGFRGNLFSTQFNLRKIQRHQLIEEGSSFLTIDSDFVVSSHHDFHPTDVLEDGDGSLLVVDTGGWYKLCCPTSQLQKPDVLGAIYRVKRTSVEPLDDPFGKEIHWTNLSIAELVMLLEDHRYFVKRHAIEELSKRGLSTIESLKSSFNSKDLSITARQNILWVLNRISGSQARQAIRSALNLESPELLRTAIHSAGIHHDEEALFNLVGLLGHQDVHVKRKAAEAIGRIGNADAVEAILNHSKHLSDPSLEHALIYALIQIDADPKTLMSAIGSNRHPNIRRVALTALSQIEAGSFHSQLILSLIDSKDDGLSQRAKWVATNHPEWGRGLVDHFRSTLIKQSEGGLPHVNVSEQLEVFIKQPEIQWALGRWLGDERMDSEVQQIILKLMRHESVRRIPETWLSPVVELMHSDSMPVVFAAFQTVTEWTLTERERVVLLPELEEVQNRKTFPWALRLAIIESIVKFNPVLGDEAMEMTVDAFKDSSHPELQEMVLAIWRDANLKPDQLKVILTLLNESGPLHISQLVGLFHGQSLLELGEALIQAIEVAPANASIRPDLLLHAVNSFPEKIQNRARSWLKTMEIDLEKQRLKLNQILTHLPEGDVRRGQAIFKSENTACSACHQIGYVGGDTGPDLSRIGSVRTERDLLEAILFPSASFVRSYEPMIVETLDGEAYSGVMHREGGDGIRLVLGAGNEMRLGQEEIDTIRPGQVSVMPSGLDEQLTKQELADLLAFLKSRK